MLYQYTNSWDGLPKRTVPQDYILLWRLPELQDAPPRVGEPYGRCYLRLQPLFNEMRVFFSVVQADAAPPDPDLARLATFVTRNFFLDVFHTRWLLHIPAGLNGAVMDSFATVAFDWRAGADGPQAHNPREGHWGRLVTHPLEIPGIHESDKGLFWINSDRGDGYSDGYCTLRLYEGGAESEAPGGRTVIITNRWGYDVSRWIQAIALWLREVFNLEPPAVTWIAHYAVRAYPHEEGSFQKGRLTRRGFKWEPLPREEGQALLAHSRSFQLPLGPVEPNGDPLVRRHLQQMGQRLGMGKQYVGSAAREARDHIFIHEDGRCWRLQYLFRGVGGQSFSWGGKSRPAEGLAYSILADLLGLEAADRYWLPFHEQVIATRPFEEDFLLSQEEIEGWLEQFRRENAAGMLPRPDGR